MPIQTTFASGALTFAAACGGALLWRRRRPSRGPGGLHDPQGACDAVGIEYDAAQARWAPASASATAGEGFTPESAPTAARPAPEAAQGLAAALDASRSRADAEGKRADAAEARARVAEARLADAQNKLETARAARRRAVAASGRRLAEIEAERDAAARAATAARAEAADMRARLWRESSVAVVRARAMAQAARLRNGGSEEGPDAERAASERGATTPRSPAAESRSEEGVFEATESVDDSPNHDSPCTPEGAAAKRLCFAHQRPVTAFGLVNKSTGGDDSDDSATATMAPSKASRGHRCVEPSSAVAAEPPAPPPSALASPDAAATAAAARTATTSVVANLAAVQLLRVSMETVSSSGVSPEDEQPLLDDSKLDDLVVSSEDIAALRKLAADASERIRQGGVEAGASAPRASTGVQGNVLLDFAADAAVAAASCAVAAESAEEESSSSAASSPAKPAVGWSVLNSGAYISHLHLPTQHPLPAVAASFGGDEVTDGCGDDDGALYTRNEPQSYLRAIVRATELRAAVRPPRRATGIGRGTPTLAATDTPDLADEGARRTAAATPLTADLTNTAPVAAASRSVDSDGWGDLFSQKRHAEGSLDLVHSAAEYHNRQQRA